MALFFSWFAISVLAILPASAATEIYGENLRSSNQKSISYEFLLRQTIYETEVFKSYFGVHFYQDPGEVVDNSGNSFAFERKGPLLGLMSKSQWGLQALLEFRQLEQKNSQKIEAISELRLGVIYGFYKDFSSYFSESFLNQELNIYCESFLIPRFSNQAIATIKFQLFQPLWKTEKIKLSPYLELFVRQSPSVELGRSSTEARLGGHALLQASRNLSVQVFYFAAAQIDEKNKGNNENQALLVLGGSFQ